MLDKKVSIKLTVNITKSMNNLLLLERQRLENQKIESKILRHAIDNTNILELINIKNIDGDFTVRKLFNIDEKTYNKIKELENMLYEKTGKQRWKQKIVYYALRKYFLGDNYDK